MTITLNTHQEQAIRQAIGAGEVASVEEFIDRAIAGLQQKGHEAGSAGAARTVLEQGLGLFESPADAALLDEVVTLAYEERRHPSKQDPLL